MVYIVITSTKDVTLADCRICDTVESAITAYNETFDAFPDETIRVLKMPRVQFYNNIAQDYRITSYIEDAIPVNPLSLIQPK